MNFLKSLYRGEIAPYQSKPLPSEERTQYQKECERLDTLLKEHLTKEDYELFREFNKYTDFITDLDLEEKFCEGFKLCADLMKEVQ